MIPIPVSNVFFLNAKIITFSNGWGMNNKKIRTKKTKQFILSSYDVIFFQVNITSNL